MTTAGTAELVRPALEAGWLVAKAGLADTPPVPPPRVLRPLLSHARLTPAALRTIEKALRDDDEFRQRVASAVDEGSVGRPGWLLLTQPDGWEDELAALTGELAAATVARREDQEEQTARRRLKGAEDARSRAEAAAATAAEAVARLSAELAVERKARRVAEETVSSLRRRVGSLEGERDSAHRRASEADALRETAGGLEAEVAALRSLAAASADQVTATRAELEAMSAAAAGAITTGDAPVAPTLDVAAIAGAVAAAGQAAADLGAALQVAADHLDVDRVARAPDSPVEDGSASVSTPAPHRRPRRPPAVRRTPISLPPAVFDDSVEAAEHLVRVGGVIVLVDGYNVSKTYRPDLPAPQLRGRLVDALTELAARTGADIHVVFDGAEGAGPPAPTGVRRAVKVSFSAPGVEADDVILGLVDQLPPHRPVVVASSDRRVQDGSRLRGANAISSEQLLGVLRRGD